MKKPTYRKPGNRKAAPLKPALQAVVDAFADDPLVVVKSIRDDGRGVILQSWEGHGPIMDGLVGRGLEYVVSFPVARRPGGGTEPSKLFAITQPEPTTVQTRIFGPITLPRTGAVLVDGGTDGRPGHRLDVDISGSLRWERRTGAVGRGGCAGTGSLGLHGNDWSDYLRLSDAAWQRMKLRPAAPAPKPGVEEPAWLWVVAMRVGDEVRVRESQPGPSAHPDGEIARLLEWMARRVESWCVAAEHESERCESPVPVVTPATVSVGAAAASTSTRMGGSIGDAVARVRQEAWGPIIPPLKRRD